MSSPPLVQMPLPQTGATSAPHNNDDDGGGEGGRRDGGDTDTDMKRLFEAFRELVRASASASAAASSSNEPKYIPPQIPVTCRGETRMFGRRTLAAMHYSKAVRMFRKRFQREGDITRLPGKYEPEMLFDHYPQISLVATFIGATTRRQRAGTIDESSWSELLKNVETIEVVITPVLEES